MRLDELIAEYEKLGPELRRGGPQDSWWSNFRRELGSLVDIHSADVPSAKPNARYCRALSRLESGDVDSALAETMRLPGASRAEAWVAKARRYVAAHRALDEIESVRAAGRRGADALTAQKRGLASGLANAKSGRRAAQRAFRSRRQDAGNRRESGGVWGS